MERRKLVLSDGMPNGPERDFLDAVYRKYNENKDLEYIEAMKLMASEHPDLARRYSASVRRLSEIAS